MKINRNAPCPCGSGKKYKKCCLQKEEQEKIEIPNYSIGQLLTYEVVDALSTDKIILILKQMGIQFNQQIFLNAVDKYYSAEEISDNWFKKYPVNAEGRMEDFPWFAAWVLWERLAPKENLSLEKLDDLIELGYFYLEKNKIITACDIWLKVWEGLKYRIKLKHEDFKSLSSHYEGTFFISNFVQDLEMELFNAGKYDHRYFEKRIKFCQEFCKYFPDADELILHNMKQAIANSYVQLDDYENAEKEFEKLVEKYPRNPWSYIGWGDIYFLEERKDFQKARTLYKKALEIAVDEIDKESIMERLTDLEQEILH